MLNVMLNLMRTSQWCLIIGFFIGLLFLNADNTMLGSFHIRIEVVRFV